jgi:hypothetical protein
MIEILSDGGFMAAAAPPIIEGICIQASSFIKVEFAFCPRSFFFAKHNPNFIYKSRICVLF